MTDAELLKARLLGAAQSLAFCDAITSGNWAAYEAAKNEFRAHMDALHRQRVDALKERLPVKILSSADVHAYAVAMDEMGKRAVIVDRGVVCVWTRKNSWMEIRQADEHDKKMHPVVIRKKEKTS